MAGGRGRGDSLGGDMPLAVTFTSAGSIDPGGQHRLVRLGFRRWRQLHPGQPEPHLHGARQLCGHADGHRQPGGADGQHRAPGGDGAQPAAGGRGLGRSSRWSAAAGRDLNLLTIPMTPTARWATCRWQFHDGSTYWGSTAYYTYQQAGVYQVTLTVWDDRDATGTDTLTVYVGQPNQPPVADAGPDQAVSTLAPVTLDGSGSGDPDGHLPLAYRWTQTGGPAVTLSNPAAVSPTFAAPPDPAELIFTLAVTDSLGLPDPTPDQVVVTVGNQSPVADAGPDQGVSTLALVTLNGSGSGDPDGDLPLAYRWTQTGGPAVTLSDPLGVSPTFTAPGSSGVLTFTLVVTDSLGLSSAPDEVVIMITGQAYRFYLPVVIRH